MDNRPSPAASGCFLVWVVVCILAALTSAGLGVALIIAAISWLNRH